MNENPVYTPIPNLYFHVNPEYYDDKEGMSTDFLDDVEALNAVFPVVEKNKDYVKIKGNKNSFWGYWSLPVKAGYFIEKEPPISITMSKEMFEI
jgi:hypothetical protein